MVSKATMSLNPANQVMSQLFSMRISSYSLAPGDLVLIHGSVLHKSERNTSANTRFAYTFHMIESPPFAVYDEKNWLQPTQAMPFSHILREAAYVDNSYGLQG